MESAEPKKEEEKFEGENEGYEDEDVSMDEEDGDLNELEKKVTANPYDYDSHVQLIAKARKSGEFEKLRQARERLHAVYPLAPTLWLEWLEDEKSVSSDPEKIRALFETAVKDYTSFDVWLEYVQWAIGNSAPDKTRELFERAVSAVGLHVAKGCLMWDAYREFESALLQLYPDSQDDEEIAKARNMQISRILAIFKRQLSLPLVGLEDAYEEYVEFLRDTEPDKEIVKNYQLALKLIQLLKPYEDKLAVASSYSASEPNNSGGSYSDSAPNNSPSLDAYNAYLDFECSHKNLSPARIQALFERTITEHCLNEPLWLRYLTWLDRNIKIPDVTLDVYRRAVANCPQSTRIWQNYLLAHERLKSDPQTIEDLFNAALDGSYYNTEKPLEFRDFYLTRMYQIRRMLTRDPQPDYTRLRNAFETGESFLKFKFFSNWDSDFHYRQCWARVEATVLKDREAFRKIFDQILTENNNGSRANFWLEYFTVENQIFRGSSDPDIEYCRKLLIKATNSVSDYPESIFQQFLQFELENGQLPDYDQALQRIEHQKKRLKDRKAQKETHSAKESFNKQKPKFQKRNFDQKREMPSEIKETSVKKRKIQPDPEKADYPPEVPQKKVQSDTGTFQYNQGLEKNKLFVKNLNYGTSEKELEAFFKPYGNLSSVRIVRHKNGASKGLAYIEYADDESAAKALKATDGQTFLKRKLQVAVSNPPPRQQKPVLTGAQKPVLTGSGSQEPKDAEKPRPIFLTPRAVAAKSSSVAPRSGDPPVQGPSAAPSTDNGPSSSTTAAGSTSNINGFDHDQPKSVGLSNDKFREMFLKK